MPAAVAVRIAQKRIRELEEQLDAVKTIIDIVVDENTSLHEAVRIQCENSKLFTQERTMKKALVVLSGGQDSTTCLYWALALGYKVHALTFDYGQRHRREILAANTVAQMAGVGANHEIARLGDILVSTSPLVSNNELEQYKDHQSLPGGIEKTFVPMRNQLFLTIAANRAIALGCEALVTGVCQEDFGGYPDCRQVFVNVLERATNLGTWGNDEFVPSPSGAPVHRLQFLTPLMYMTKAESIRLALEVGAYKALAFSHTAYDGAYPPVGKDHATLLRAKGFEEAGIPDPLVLRACLEGVMEVPATSNYDQRKYKSYGKLAGLIPADE